MAHNLQNYKVLFPTGKPQTRRTQGMGKEAAGLGQQDPTEIIPKLRLWQNFPTPAAASQAWPKKSCLSEHI